MREGQGMNGGRGYNNHRGRHHNGNREGRWSRNGDRGDRNANLHCGRRDRGMGGRDGYGHQSSEATRGHYADYNPRRAGPLRERYEGNRFLEGRGRMNTQNNRPHRGGGRPNLDTTHEAFRFRPEDLQRQCEELLQKKVVLPDLEKADIPEGVLQADSHLFKRLAWESPMQHQARVNFLQWFTGKYPPDTCGSSVEGSDSWVKATAQSEMFLAMAAGMFYNVRFLGVSYKCVTHDRIREYIDSIEPVKS